MQHYSHSLWYLLQLLLLITSGSPSVKLIWLILTGLVPNDIVPPCPRQDGAPLIYRMFSCRHTKDVVELLERDGYHGAEIVPTNSRASSLSNEEEYKHEMRRRT